MTRPPLNALIAAEMRQIRERREARATAGRGAPAQQSSLNATGADWMAWMDWWLNSPKSYYDDQPVYEYLAHQGYRYTLPSYSFFDRREAPHLPEDWDSRRNFDHHSSRYDRWYVAQDRPPHTLLVRVIVAKPANHILGAPNIQRFFNRLVYCAAEGGPVDAGLLVTTAGFTEAARRLAVDRDIMLIDGSALAPFIAERVQVYATTGVPPHPHGQHEPWGGSAL